MASEPSINTGNKKKKYILWIYNVGWIAFIKMEEVFFLVFGTNRKSISGRLTQMVELVDS